MFSDSNQSVKAKSDPWKFYVNRFTKLYMLLICTFLSLRSTLCIIKSALLKLTLDLVLDGHTKAHHAPSEFASMSPPRILITIFATFETSEGRATLVKNEPRILSARSQCKCWHLLVEKRDFCLLNCQFWSSFKFRFAIPRLSSFSNIGFYHTVHHTHCFNTSAWI